MQFDVTWTITAIIAVSSFLSPIAVAIINNRHQIKMRKMELDHDDRIMQMNLQQQALTRQSDIYYSDKKVAFSDFTQCAGAFSLSRQSGERYHALHSSIDKALLFCNSENQKLLIDFRNYVDTEIYGSTYGQRERDEYSKALIEISLSLNRELELTKPVIDYKCHEH